MDRETGQIKERNELTPAEIASDRWKELGKRPNPGCSRCHGRGYTGFDLHTRSCLVSWARRCV